MRQHCEMNNHCINQYLNVGFEGLTAVASWDITPCSPLKVNTCFGARSRLHLQGRRISRARNQRESMWQAEPAFTLVSCSDYSSTLKMEAIYSSETLVDFQRTTRRYIREDSLLQCLYVFTLFCSIMCLPISLHS
jgi:hypothetical protein